MKLSDQAISCVMMAMQKGILERVDITEVLREMHLSVSSSDQSQLVVTNPPHLEIKDDLVKTDGSDNEEEVDA